jgi:hypothetical protein
MLGLYLYASGAQRQTMTVLSTLGITESYTNVVIKNKRCQRKKKIELTPRPASIDNTTPPAITSTSERESIPLSCYSGTLRQLSDSMCAQAWQIAATGLYSNVYDNINMMFRSPEQIIGHHGTSSILLIARNKLIWVWNRHTRKWHWCNINSTFQSSD